MANTITNTQSCWLSNNRLKTIANEIAYLCFSNRYDIKIEQISKNISFANVFCSQKVVRI